MSKLPSIERVQVDLLNEVLDRVLPEIRFDAVGFADVVEFLRDVTGANIYANWRAIEATGIDRGTPVTLRLRDVTFSSFLETVLRDVCGGVPRLGYTVVKGIIMISNNIDLSTDGIYQELFNRNGVVEERVDWASPAATNLIGWSNQLQEPAADPLSRAVPVQHIAAVRSFLLPFDPADFRGWKVTSRDRHGKTMTQSISGPRTAVEAVTGLLKSQLIREDERAIEMGVLPPQRRLIRLCARKRCGEEVVVFDAEPVDEPPQTTAPNEIAPPAAVPTTTITPSITTPRTPQLPNEGALTKSAMEAESELPDPDTVLAPSRLKAKAAYAWAIETIDGAEKMTVAELHRAIMNHPQGPTECIPDNPEAFGKYLRDAGLKRYDSKGNRRYGRSVRRYDQI